MRVADCIGWVSASGSRICECTLLQTACLCLGAWSHGVFVFGGVVSRYVYVWGLGLMVCLCLGVWSQGVFVGVVSGRVCGRGLSVFVFQETLGRGGGGGAFHQRRRQETKEQEQRLRRLQLLVTPRPSPGLRPITCAWALHATGVHLSDPGMTRCGELPFTCVTCATFSPSRPADPASLSTSVGGACYMMSSRLYC